MAEVNTTVKTSGGDYTSLSTWESGEQTDLVTAQDNHVVTVFPMDDQPTSFALAGWTTSADYNIKIVADATAAATPAWQNSGAYTLAPSTGTWRVAFNQNYVHVVGIQIQGSQDLVSVTSLGFRMANCFVRQDGDARTLLVNGGVAGSSYDDNPRFINTVFINTEGTLSAGRGLIEIYSDASVSYDEPFFDYCSFWMADTTNGYFVTDTGASALTSYFIFCKIFVSPLSDAISARYCETNLAAGLTAPYQYSVAVGDMFEDYSTYDFHGVSGATGNTYGWAFEDSTDNGFRNDLYWYSYTRPYNDGYDLTDMEGNVRYSLTEGIAAISEFTPGVSLQPPTVVQFTVKTSGGDYTSLASWEAGEVADLRTNNYLYEVVVDAMADSGATLSFASWAGYTDLWRRVRIKAADGVVTSPKFGDTGTYSYTSSSSYGITGYTYDMSLELIGLQFKGGSSYAGYFGGSTTASTSWTILDRCMFWSPSSYGVGWNGNYYKVVANNTMFASGSEAGVSIGGYSGTMGDVLWFQGCSFVNQDTTLESFNCGTDSDVYVTFYSCLFWNGDMTTYGEVNTDIVGTATGVYNVSEHDGNPPGSGDVLGTYDADWFVDGANGDFSLKGAWGFRAGSEDPRESGDMRSWVFRPQLTTDIRGTARPASGSLLWTGGCENAPAVTEDTATVDSAGADYTSLAAAVSGEQTDLRDAWTKLTIQLGTFVDTTTAQVSIDGFTTSEDCTLLIKGNDAPGPAWDSTTPQCYTLHLTENQSASLALSVYDYYVSLENMQIWSEGGDSVFAYPRALWYRLWGGTETIKSLFLRATKTSYNNNAFMYAGHFNSAGTPQYEESLRILDCIFVNDAVSGETGAGKACYMDYSPSGYDLHFVHCGAAVLAGDGSAAGGGYAFDTDQNNEARFFNCWAYGAASGQDYGGMSTATYFNYSATDQASGTSALPAGYNNVYGLVDGTDFEDITSLDFTPKAQAALTGAGQDLSVTYDIDTDMDGDPRNTSAPTIGPDEDLSQLSTGEIVEATASIIEEDSVSYADLVTGTCVEATAVAQLADALYWYYILSGAIPPAEANAVTIFPTKIQSGDWDPPTDEEDSWSDQPTESDGWVDQSLNSDSWTDQ